MFEEPATKRIKRSGIKAQGKNPLSSGSSDSPPLSPDQRHSPDRTLSSSQPPDYGFEYEVVDSQPVASKQASSNADNEGDESFDFRLFASTKTNSSTPAKITLQRSPSPSTLNQAGRILRPRPNSYYFTSSVPASVLQELQHQYNTTAITTSQILQDSTIPWPGTTIPWRHISLPAFHKQIIIHRPDHHPPPVTTSSPTQPSPSTNPTPPPHRSRPNKKRRIHLRRLHTAQLSSRHHSALQLAEQAKRETEQRQREVERKEKQLIKNRMKQRRKRERLREKFDDGQMKPE